MHLQEKIRTVQSVECIQNQADDTIKQARRCRPYDDPLPQQEIDWDNCRIDPGQIAWLQRELDAADGKVLIFSHVPFMLEEYATENPHLIRNRDEITRIFECSGKVQAVFSGHYHDGCFGVHNGIPYITFSAMVIGEENAYAVVDVTDAGVRVTGFGRQKSAQWP